MDNNQACFYCNGTGKFKKPNDEEDFDRRFDRYAEFLSMGEAREKALKDTGYTLIDCPYCSGGKGKTQEA